MGCSWVGQVIQPSLVIAVPRLGFNWGLQHDTADIQLLVRLQGIHCMQHDIQQQSSVLAVYNMKMFKKEK